MSRSMEVDTSEGFHNELQKKNLSHEIHINIFHTVEDL